MSEVKVASTAPPISKLGYVDDVILFCEVRAGYTQKVLGKIFFMVGSNDQCGESRCLPFCINQFLNQIKHSWGLKYVKDKLEGKLSGWKSKNISMAGRATLIKSVAQPTYTMAGLQFPKRICDQLDAVIRRFWWNPKTKSSSFWSPIAWSLLCRPQKQGDLGFRKFWDFNQALISKLD